mmetsp:Transcript_13713/g.28060  ORF Transcript_13713/g.28060 Transcript_13713/m.28060 type:complete len:392 (+) Transcript_13713:62-1237(+)
MLQPIDQSPFCCLEALAVDDRGAGLVVLGLGDPHLLEGGKRREDGSADPHGVLPLGGGHDLDLHGGRSKGVELLGHALSDAGVHGGAAGEDDVGVQVLADVDIALHDGLEGAVVDAGGLTADEGGLEEHLGAAEPLVSDGDDVSIGQLVRLLKLRRLVGELHLLVEVKGDVSELLLDVTHNLTLGGGGEGVATLGEDLHHVVGEVAAGEVKTDDGVGKSVSLVDGDSVGDTISGVKDAASGAAGGVEGEDGLDVDVHGRDVEGLEHDLGHALAVGLGVEGSLSEEDGVLLGGDAELVVEGVVPDLLHVVPVGDDTVLNRVLQGEHSTLVLGLVSDVGVLLVHADHDSGVLGPSHNGGEDGTGGVVSGESSLAHSGSVVNDKSSNIFVSHGI